MRRGYVPLGLERSPFVFATHLPGVTATVDGFSIGEVRVSKLTWQECGLLEKSRFMDDLQDAFFFGREPLFAVFAGYPGADETTVQAIKTNAAIAVLRLTRALRLLKNGEVWNPLEFIVYTRHDNQNTRDPRLFGRLAFNTRGDEFVALSFDDIDTLDGVYTALDLFDSFRYDLVIDRVETLLAASFSPAHVSYVHRILPLIGALEVLAGGETALLAEAEWADDGIREWTDRFRSLRNTLAHGRGDHATTLRETLESTRTVIRVLLREAIAWRLLEPAALEVTGRPLVERVLQASAAAPERLATLSSQFPSLNLADDR